ncbi:MAG: hypothetical protein IKX76_03515 [Eubacterium sp.]|nr:hypothetical protein [Eubacterium sp.]
MTLQTIFEPNKERLISAVHGADSATASRLMNSELDRILYTFNDEEENPRVREAASDMIQVAKASCSLIDSTGEAKIYGRTEYGQAPPPKGKLSKWGLLLLALGLVGAFVTMAGIYILTSSAAAGVKDWQSAGLPPRYVYTIVPVATLVVAFLAGMLLKRKKTTSKETLHAETKIDGTRIYNHLLSVILVMDKCLEDIRSSARQEDKDRLKEQISAMDPAELDLLSQLLEDAYGRRGEDELAEEEISQIKFYLHRKGIDVVDWTPDPVRQKAPEGNETAGRGGWFDMMPAFKSGTIRPALVSDGKLLRKGMASARR